MENTFGRIVSKNCLQGKEIFNRNHGRGFDNTDRSFLGRGHQGRGFPGRSFQGRTFIKEEALAEEEANLKKNITGVTPEI